MSIWPQQVHFWGCRDQWNDSLRRLLEWWNDEERTFVWVSGWPYHTFSGMRFELSSLPTYPDEFVWNINMHHCELFNVLKNGGSFLSGLILFWWY